MSTRLHDLLKARYGNSLEVRHVPGGIDISSPLPRNPITDIANAVETINDDPNNTKKKALIYAGLGAAGAAGAYYMRNNSPVIKSMVSKAKHMPAGAGLLGLLGVAGLYYAKRNWEDNKNKALLGATGALGARIGSNVMTSLQFAKDNGGVLPPPTALTPAALGYGIATSTALSGFTGMADQFQQVEDAEKLKAISEDPKLTPKQREYERSMIVDKKDFLTRYPALRYAPYSEKLRELYNNKYYPRPGSSEFIRTKVRE